MPSVWAAYVDHTFGQMFDRWHADGKCARVGGSPLHAVRHQPKARISPLHQAEIPDNLTHATWADDFVLAASTKADLEGMIEEFVVHAERQSLNTQWGKVDYWSLRRPETCAVRGMEVQAKQDMHLLGLSLVTGGGTGWKRASRAPGRPSMLTGDP